MKRGGERFGKKSCLTQFLCFSVSLKARALVLRVAFVRNRALLSCFTTNDRKGLGRVATLHFLTDKTTDQYNILGTCHSLKKALATVQSRMYLHSSQRMKSVGSIRLSYDTVYDSLVSHMYLVV